MSYRSWPQRVSSIVSRPATYRGVSMRSQLEADFAYYLDGKQVDWDYEPELFGPAGARYLPDFRLTHRGTATYVEVKPTVEQAENAKPRLELVWDRHPDATLLIVSAEESRFFAAVRGGPWETWVAVWKHR